MPTTLMGFALQSFFPGKEPASSSEYLFPLAVTRFLLPQFFRKTGSEENPPRLQGFNPLPKLDTQM
jgi:hypothetical protein